MPLDAEKVKVWSGKSAEDFEKLKVMTAAACEAIEAVAASGAPVVCHTSHGAVTVAVPHEDTTITVPPGWKQYESLDDFEAAHPEWPASTSWTSHGGGNVHMSGNYFTGGAVFPVWKQYQAVWKDDAESDASAQQFGHMIYEIESSNSYMDAAKAMRQLLPGLDTRLHCPACSYAHDMPSTIWHLIQHLNDGHRWTREAIADWLDTLDVDLTFPTPKESDNA